MTAENVNVEANRSVVLVYVGTIALLEIITALVSPFFGLIGSVLLLLALLFHAAVIKDPVQRRAVQVLLLLPLLRILSLTLALREINPIYWNAMIGFPLLVSAGLMMRLLKLSVRDVGLWPPRLLRDLPVAASGLALIPINYTLLKIDWLPDPWQLGHFIAFPIILFIFVGFTEELLFRGILQRVMEETFGARGILIAVGLYAVTYVGSLSPLYILFIAAVGLFFAYCRKFGSLWGVTFAHGIMLVGTLYLYFKF